MLPIKERKYAIEVTVTKELLSAHTAFFMPKIRKMIKSSHFTL